MEASTLSYLLQHTSLTLQRQTDQIIQERLGIGVAQFKLLHILRERPGVQQRFLADSLGQTEASISRQVKLLGKKGLLTIQTNPANKREHLMSLTVKGIRLTDAAQEIVDGYHAPAFERLSDKEKEQFSQLLQQLHLYCCQDGRPFSCELPWFGPER